VTDDIEELYLIWGTCKPDKKQAEKKFIALLSIASMGNRSNAGAQKGTKKQGALNAPLAFSASISC